MKITVILIMRYWIKLFVIWKVSKKQSHLHLSFCSGLRRRKYKQKGISSLYLWRKYLINNWLCKIIVIVWLNWKHLSFWLIFLWDAISWILKVKPFNWKIDQPCWQVQPLSFGPMLRHLRNKAVLSALFWKVISLYS